MVPSSRPKQPRAEVEKLLRSAGVTDKVALVGVRGYYKNSLGKPNVNDLGIYDDAMFIVSPEVFAAFNANVDPSVLRPNIATLVPGVYRYKKGRHGISRGPGYPALRPATTGEKLPVRRWNPKTQDYYYDQGTAINIHKGSFRSTSSEGCQTIYPSQYDGFINLVYSEMNRWSQKTISYVLVEN